jgi:hypothetical protein
VLAPCGCVSASAGIAMQTSTATTPAAKAVIGFFMLFIPRMA